MNIMSKLIASLSLLAFMVLFISCNTQTTVWKIGNTDSLSSEFALSPDRFREFVEQDFGYEDKVYVVGYSEEREDFPYVLPGPVDTWGGTWPASGWRTNRVNILFGVDEVPDRAGYKLVIRLVDYAKKFLPLVKVTINNQEEKIQLSAPGYKLSKQHHPRLNEPFVDTASISGDLSAATPKTIEIPIESSILKNGGNAISITVLQGSWIMFDQIMLEGPKTNLVKPSGIFIRSVEPAKYQLTVDEKEVQPLLVNVQHLEGSHDLTVEIDDKQVFNEKVDKGQYEFEVSMPAVSASTKSSYEILADGVVLEEGVVLRSKQKSQTPADYVDTRIGTAHSRWMIAPGPWMPFSMVKMSPDNQNGGWQAGYDPSFETVGTFSHIHEWTLAGLGIFATNGKLITNIGNESDPDSGYRSRIDKNTEEAPIGYYKVHLSDYDIKAEITATTRCAFQRYTFPKQRDSSRILIDLHIPAEYRYKLKEVSVKKISDTRIEGFTHQYSARVWSNDAEQDYTLNFVLEFDRPIKKMGRWLNGEVTYGDMFEPKEPGNAGLFLEFDTEVNPVVQVRSGISLVSIRNAGENLQKEITDRFGWDFEAVRKNQTDEWNDIFNRVKITTSNRLEKMRFYNAMYRSLCSRNIWSDINGEWKGTDGKVNRLKNPNDVALGCDAFWNTFWNLNQMWNLITPEWSSRWVKSQLAMYDQYGWLAKGPAGMNYIPVMVAEHEIPMMVSAYQMGIRDFDADKVLEAAVKMQTTPSQKLHSGYVGNRDIKAYIKYHYVPSDKGRFSNSMEYSYDDWCVGQLAKSLNNSGIYNTFNARGYWWKNAIDRDGYCHLRLSNGEWEPDFDPFRSGANEHYVEGNAWQLTFFVPQDVPALANIIGKEQFVKRLDWGFAASEPWRYNGMNDQYWDYPVMQGNQQSMHFAFLFNWVGKPWLTQKWSRSILERYYGYGVTNAYLGDEDQGQMSAWFVMAAMGLFQTDGGCRSNPVYEIGSPLFSNVEIDLGEAYGRGKKFTIIANNASRLNIYVQSASLNGEPLNSFKFPAKELLRGGTLVLEMGSEPNPEWGVE
jgi:predicted alpha-1,2-mannosidase